MFTLKINTNNDAFEHEGNELARILREIADDIDSFSSINNEITKPVRDINGNTIGKWELK